MKKKIKDLSDLYFYKGKYRTEEGLKRALIKDGIIWTSPKRNYYHYIDVFEYCYSFEMLRDYVTDYGLCSADDAKHFRKWLNQKIKENKIKVINTSWYHCDENDGIGEIDWLDTLDSVMDTRSSFDLQYPNDFIETSEQSVEEYCQTLNREDLNKFESLSSDKQYKLAMNWRIDMYKNI